MVGKQVSSATGLALGMGGSGEKQECSGGGGGITTSPQSKGQGGKPKPIDQRDPTVVAGWSWCSSCSDDGWRCASVQHLWVRRDALQARDTSQCNLVLVTRPQRRCRAIRTRCWLVLFLHDDGWLCASVQHLWVWEDVHCSLIHSTG